MVLSVCRGPGGAQCPENDEEFVALDCCHYGNRHCSAHLEETDPLLRAEYAPSIGTHMNQTYTYETQRN
jgi:hypothetical protein